MKLRGLLKLFATISSAHVCDDNPNLSLGLLLLLIRTSYPLVQY